MGNLLSIIKGNNLSGGEWNISLDGKTLCFSSTKDKAGHGIRILHESEGMVHFNDLDGNGYSRNIFGWTAITNKMALDILESYFTGYLCEG